MFIITAYQCISPEVTVMTFEKCCIPNGVDETEGDVLWNDGDDCVDVRSKCEEDEGTDFEDRNTMIGKGR
jgi:hypothetical protein